MPAPTLDVWFVATEQVYRGVPFSVATGWVEQGRLAAGDKTRPTGSKEAWVTVATHPLLADYLPLPAGVPLPTELTPTEPVDPPDAQLFRKRQDDDDDDVDMIPLIDVSLVLLVFFMMTASMPKSDSAVDVPPATGVEIREDDTAVISVIMDLREGGEAYYALRVGEGRTSKTEDNNIATTAEAKARIEALVPQFSTPPEVRIVCHKQIKHIRVRELVSAIDPLRRDGRITSYRAEVSEQPK